MGNKKVVASKRPTTVRLVGQDRKNIFLTCVFISLLIFAFFSTRLVIRFAGEISDLEARLARAQQKISGFESDREQMLINDKREIRRHSKLSSTIREKDFEISELRSKVNELTAAVRGFKTDPLAPKFDGYTENHLLLVLKSPRVGQVEDKLNSEWKDADIDN